MLTFFSEHKAGDIGCLLYGVLLAADSGSEPPEKAADASNADFGIFTQAVHGFPLGQAMVKAAKVTADAHLKHESGKVWFLKLEDAIEELTRMRDSLSDGDLDPQQAHSDKVKKCVTDLGCKVTNVRRCMMMLSDTETPAFQERVKFSTDMVGDVDNKLLHVVEAQATLLIQSVRDRKQKESDQSADVLLHIIKAFRGAPAQTVFQVAHYAIQTRDMIVACRTVAGSVAAGACNDEVVEEFRANYSKLRTIHLCVVDPKPESSCYALVAFRSSLNILEGLCGETLKEMHPAVMTIIDSALSQGSEVLTRDGSTIGELHIPESWVLPSQFQKPIETVK